MSLTDIGNPTDAIASKKNITSMVIPGPPIFFPSVMSAIAVAIIKRNRQKYVLKFRNH